MQEEKTILKCTKCNQAISLVTKKSTLKSGKQGKREIQTLICSNCGKVYET